jgi:prepilin-type N-terminal cleavage/methylation domain-containing protein
MRIRKGFTLIELIITLAILTIVIGAISGLFTYSLRVYNKGEKLSQVQFDVRMASDYVIKEVRNTEKISLTDDTLSNTLDLSALQARYPSVKKVEFEVKFFGANYLLAFKIDGSDSNSQNDYSVSSEIILNNITNAFVGTGETLYYD